MLPSICLAIGATAVASSSRGSWFRLVGEALLLTAVTAGAGLGWYTLSGASLPIMVLCGIAMVLAIAVALVFIVGELTGERVGTQTQSKRELIHGK